MQSHQPEEEYLLPALFDEHPVRQVYDKTTEMRWFSVVEIVQILTQQPDPTTARKYWTKLKQRLGKEGSQLATNCHQLKLPASDGKNYLTDVATAETLLHLVQSIPNPKAEPIKQWPAKVTSSPVPMLISGGASSESRELKRASSRSIRKQQAWPRSSE